MLDMVCGEEEDCWHAKLFQHRNGPKVVAVAVIEREKDVLAARRYTSQEIFWRNEEITLFQEILYEAAKHLHRNPLLWVQEVTISLSLILKETVKEKAHQSRTLLAHCKTQVREHPIQRVDHSFQREISLQFPSSLPSVGMHLPVT